MAHRPRRSGTLAHGHPIAGVLRAASILRTAVAILAVSVSVSVSGVLAAAQQPVPGADLHAVGEPPAATGTIEAQSADVQTIFQLANQDRAAQSLPALAWNPELATAALAHAKLMAEAATSELSHRYPGEPDLATRASQSGAHFSSIAENIAQGGNARQIEKQWMTSVPHQTNILDPRMNAIGVAVFASGGTLYAVQDFAAAQSMLAPQAAERAVENQLQALTPPTLSARPPDAARQYCLHADQSSTADKSSARFQLQWQSSCLTLPQPLVQAVRSARYTAFSVGVCPATDSSNRAFATYHVAVLLY